MPDRENEKEEEAVISANATTSFTVSAQIHQSADLKSPQLQTPTGKKSLSHGKRLSPVAEVVGQAESSAAATPIPARHPVVTFKTSPDEEEEEATVTTSMSWSTAKRVSHLPPSMPPAGRDWRKLMQTFRRLKIAQTNKEHHQQDPHFYSYSPKSHGKVIEGNLLVPQNSLDELSFAMLAKQGGDLVSMEDVRNNKGQPTRFSKKGWLVHQGSLDECSSAPGVRPKKRQLVAQHSLDIQNYSPKESAPKSSLDDLRLLKCRHPPLNMGDKPHDPAASRKPLWPPKALRSLIPQKSLDLPHGHEEGYCEIIRHSQNTERLPPSLQGSLGSLVGEGRSKPLLVPQNSVEFLAEPLRPTPTALRRSRLVPQHSLDIPIRRRGHLVHQLSLGHIEPPCLDLSSRRRGQLVHQHSLGHIEPPCLDLPSRRQGQLVHQLSLGHIEPPCHALPLQPGQQAKQTTPAGGNAELQQSVESLIAFYSGRASGKEEASKRSSPKQMPQKFLQKTAAPSSKTDATCPKGVYSVQRELELSRCGVPPPPTPPPTEPEVSALPLLQAASAQLQFLQAARAEMNPAQAARTELLLLHAAKAELEFLRAAQEKLEYLRAARNQLLTTQARNVTTL